MTAEPRPCLHQPPLPDEKYKTQAGAVTLCKVRQGEPDTPLGAAGVAGPALGAGPACVSSSVQPADSSLQLHLRQRPSWKRGALLTRKRIVITGKAQSWGPGKGAE